MNTAPSGIMQSPFVEPAATSMTSAEFWSAIESLPKQSGLRPKRLKFVETYPEKSMDLHCIAEPVGRYEIGKSPNGWSIWLVDRRNGSLFVSAVSGSGDARAAALKAAQDDYDNRMLEGMEHA